MERVEFDVTECERRKGAIPVLVVQLPLGHMLSLDHMYQDHVYRHHMSVDRTSLNRVLSRMTPNQLPPLYFITQPVVSLT